MNRNGTKEQTEQLGASHSLACPAINTSLCEAWRTSSDGITATSNGTLVKLKLTGRPWTEAVVRRTLKKKKKKEPVEEVEAGVKITDSHKYSPSPKAITEIQSTRQGSDAG